MLFPFRSLFPFQLCSKKATRNPFCKNIINCKLKLLLRKNLDPFQDARVFCRIVVIVCNACAMLVE
jgi:hypothetical protein